MVRVDEDRGTVLGKVDKDKYVVVDGADEDRGAVAKSNGPPSMSVSQLPPPPPIFRGNLWFSEMDRSR